MLYTQLPVFKASWLDISMDSWLGLPHAQQSMDFIFLVLDRFSKITYFIAY